MALLRPKSSQNGALLQIELAERYTTDIPKLRKSTSKQLDCHSNFPIDSKTTKIKVKDHTH